MIFLSIGLHKLKGPVSVWYLARSPSAISFSYLAIPFGVVFLLWALAATPLVHDEWKLNLFTLAAIFGFLSIFLPIRFLKPSWLKWLEQEHHAILPVLKNEIHRIGYHEWDRRINTRQDLETWVLEVKEHLHYPSGH